MMEAVIFHLEPVSNNHVTLDIPEFIWLEIHNS